ncbi:MAG TPA: transaldolase family protein [Aggregatilineales bacterium]|nr:transaldolase family protein [Aggregatilineales bacterium]
MALFLDSANIEIAKQAQELGFIDGITTNPKSISETGRSAMEILSDLVEIFDGHVFHYLTAASLDARIDEAWEAYEVRPDRVVIKIPMTVENIRIIARLPGVDIAMTGVFSPAQAYIAAQAQAHYVIPYFHHASEVSGNGAKLVREVVNAVSGTDTHILAGNITSIDEALAAISAGAHNLTLSMPLIEAMATHELTLQMIQGTNP